MYVLTLLYLGIILKQKFSVDNHHRLLHYIFVAKDKPKERPITTLYPSHKSRKSPLCIPLRSQYHPSCEGCLQLGYMHDTITVMFWRASYICLWILGSFLPNTNRDTKDLEKWFHIGCGLQGVWIVKYPYYALKYIYIARSYVGVEVMIPWFLITMKETFH